MNKTVSFHRLGYCALIKVRKFIRNMSSAAIFLDETKNIFKAVKIPQQELLKYSLGNFLRWLVPPKKLSDIQTRVYLLERSVLQVINIQNIERQMSCECIHAENKNKFHPLI